jgi:hypothetical protein
VSVSEPPGILNLTTIEASIGRAQERYSLRGVSTDLTGRRSLLFRFFVPALDSVHFGRINFRCIHFG